MSRDPWKSLRPTAPARAGRDPRPSDRGARARARRQSARARGERARTMVRVKDLAPAVRRALARVVQGKARRGVFAGKHVKFGNRVSEDGGNKTRRRWLPNAQKKRVYSELLEEMIPMRVTAHALRCMDKAGGLDEYVLRTRDEDLRSVFALELKARLRAKRAETRSVVDYGETVTET